MWFKLQTEKRQISKTTCIVLTLLALSFLLLNTFKSNVNSVIKCLIDDDCFTEVAFDENDALVNNHYVPSHGQQFINVIADERSQRNKLLIYSLARSGSSFLGEIFNRQNDVFYTYEPLHTVNAFMKAGVFPAAEYKYKANEVLHDFFQCNFAEYDPYLKFISYPELSNPHFRLMSKVMSSPPFCEQHVTANATEAEYQKYCYKLNPFLVERHCKRKRNVVIKELVHRFPLNTISGLPTLLNDNSFRAVYLIRDPRAIVWSMMKIGWIGHHEQAFARTVKAAANKICQIFFENYLMLNWLIPRIHEKVVVVRYEDLISQPVEVVKNLFKFSHIPLDETTINWVVNNTHGQLDSEDTRESFSVLLRNGTYSLNSWRKQLPFNYITHIQDTCGYAMKEFGYVLYSKLENVLNTDTLTFTSNANMSLLLSMR